MLFMYHARICKVNALQSNVIKTVGGLRCWCVSVSLVLKCINFYERNNFIACQAESYLFIYLLWLLYKLNRLTVILSLAKSFNLRTIERELESYIVRQFLPTDDVFLQRDTQCSPKLQTISQHNENIHSLRLFTSNYELW